MAILFTSSSSQSAATVSSLATPSSLTICAWAYFISFPGTNRPLGKADDFEWRCNGSGVLFNDTGVSGGAGVSITGNLSTSTLYHIATTNNLSTGAAAIYLNGSLDNSVGSGQTSTAASATFTLGTRTGSGNYANVSLEDVRIYNRVLSAAEISTIYACRGTDGIVNGLLNRWLLNENSQGTAASGAGILKDLTGNNNLTPSNSPTWEYSNSVISSRRVA